MSLFACLVILILFFGLLAYHRVSLFTLTLIVAILLVYQTVIGNVGIISWVIYFCIAAVFHHSKLRKIIISKPTLNLFKKLLPPLSDTEKAALEAGTIWWDAELFSGNPDWNKLHHFSSPRLTDKEQAFLDGPVDIACSMVNQHQISHELADLPESVWRYLKENGFFSLIIKKEYGGLAFSAYAQSKVLQKLAGVSCELATVVGVPNSLGPGELLQAYGTQQQKSYWLPRLAKGQEIPCFALTSPEAGSDASSITDEGIICYQQWQQKDTLGVKLNWNKRYITLAPIASVIGLAFKLKDPEKLLGKQTELGITCALIPANLPGITIGRRHFPLNCMFPNGPIQGKDVFIPLDYIIGGVEMAGNGWRMLMECLAVGRGITLPSNATGGIKTLALASGAYARIRRQFKVPIGSMEGIEEPLARLAGNAYLMDATCALTTSAIDLGEKPSVISAIVKYHLTHKLQYCIIDAMDIHGGKGICLGPKNYLGRGYQAAPIATTVEGANILTRCLIIFGQGVIRCHPYIQNEMLATQELDYEKALDQFDNAFFDHLGFTLSNFARSFYLGLTHGYLSRVPFKDKTKTYYQAINKFSANLACISDLVMLIYGGKLKRKERISARLGDILSNLFLASACLKKFDDDGREQTNLPLLSWAVEDCLYHADIALNEILTNLPKSLAVSLRLIINPLNRSFKRPSDQLEHQLAQILQTPSKVRSNLAKDQFLTPCDNHPIGIQEQTLLDILACEPLYQKINQASETSIQFKELDKIAELGLELGVINNEEASLLKRAEIGRLKSINVDDFESDYFIRHVSKTKN